MKILLSAPLLASLLFLSNLISSHSVLAEVEADSESAFELSGELSTEAMFAIPPEAALGAPLVSLNKPKGSICFHDLTSYEAVRAQLPSLLQNPILYAVHQSWDLTGALRIIPNGNNIQLDAHINSTFAGVINQSDDITSACYSGNQLQVTLNNGASQSITIQNDSMVIKGYTFNITDAGTYQSVASKVPAN